MKNEETKRQPLAPVSILHSSFCLHTFPCGALVDERGNVIGIVSAKLKAPNTQDEKFEDVVKSAKDAAVLVLVY